MLGLVELSTQVERLRLSHLQITLRSAQHRHRQRQLLVLSLELSFCCPEHLCRQVELLGALAELLLGGAEHAHHQLHLLVLRSDRIARLR